MRTYWRALAKSSRIRGNPLKSFFRRAPKPALPAGERIYAIGDIHGRVDLFEALLDMIEADSAVRGPARVGIVLLGDLVDRGPDSARVVERALGLGSRFESVEALIGNHEATMLSVLRGHPDWLDDWLAFGGWQTLLSYGVSSALLAIGAHADAAEIIAAAQRAVPEAHLAWLESLPYQCRHGDYLFAHAGIRPGIAFEAQQPRDLLWIREEFLDSRVDHGAVVVHGHSISADVEERPNRIGIDTGAFNTGMLTALGLEGEERWYLKT